MPLPPIRTKDQLELYLKEASMLEHQFMAQYLYAAFSLKKDPDERCNDAQFEFVRRWASTIYRIARQEMEHLSIVNSILTAIGGQPYYGHPGEFPSQSRWYEQDALSLKRAANMPPPCEIPFRLQRFSLATARRYACMEAPHLDLVVDSDREDLLRWCFQEPDGACPSIEPGEGARPAPLAASLLGSPDEAVQIGTVQELYEAIEDGLRFLSQPGKPELFSGHCSGQSEIPSEYDIYLFPICDLSTALAGTKLVKTQGEGIDQAPGTESHYQMFVDIAREYDMLLREDPRFEASKPVPLDPKPDQYTDPATALAAEAFHKGYVVLLDMLTGYYSRWSNESWQEAPYLLKMLEQSAFAPVMTMLVRSLAEVMTLLPANDGGPAGVSFDLTAEELAILGDPSLKEYGKILFYAVPLGEVANLLDAVLQQPIPEETRPQLQFIVQNTTRMVRNLVYNYQQGIYPRFDPNNPSINCTPATGCDCD